MKKQILGHGGQLLNPHITNTHMHTHTHTVCSVSDSLSQQNETEMVSKEEILQSY